MRLGKREAYETGAMIGRGSKDVEAVDFLQAVVGVPAELVFVAGDFFKTDEVEIIDRCAERDGGSNRWRAGFELGWQFGRRKSIRINAVDHAAAAEECRHN